MIVRWPSALGGFLAVCAGGAVASSVSPARQAPSSPANVDAAQAVVSRTCSGCHNDRTRSGNISLESFDVARAGQHADVTEKMIRKLRAGQMPPPGTKRPDEAALAELADMLEAQADAHATEPDRKSVV